MIFSFQFSLLGVWRFFSFCFRKTINGFTLKQKTFIGMWTAGRSVPPKGTTLCSTSRTIEEHAMGKRKKLVTEREATPGLRNVEEEMRFKANQMQSRYLWRKKMDTLKAADAISKEIDIRESGSRENELDAIVSKYQREYQQRADRQARESNTSHPKIKGIITVPGAKQQTKHSWSQHTQNTKVFRSSVMSDFLVDAQEIPPR